MWFLRRLHSIPQSESYQVYNKSLRDIFNISIKYFDRENLFIIVELDSWCRTLQELLLRHQVVDFSGINVNNRAIIDPVHLDFSLKKIESSLKAIKNPPLAARNPLIQVPNRTKPYGRARNKTQAVPCEQFIWDAHNLPQTSRNPVEIKTSIASVDKLEKEPLNPSQIKAIESLLSNRLSLIWGPPGTGKTSTLARGIRALLDFESRNNPTQYLKILITAHTWVAIDTLCKKLIKELHTEEQSCSLNVELFRLYSSQSKLPTQLGSHVNLISTSIDGNFSKLLKEIESPTQHLIVFATPHQTHNLRANNLTNQRVHKCLTMSS